MFTKNLQVIIDSGGKLSTRLYDKCDDFDFHILVVCTFHSSLDMHDAAHTMRISDIATSAWLIDFCHKAIESFKKFYGRYQDLIEKYQRSVNVMVNDSFP